MNLVLLDDPRWKKYFPVAHKRPHSPALEDEDDVPKCHNKQPVVYETDRRRTSSDNENATFLTRLDVSDVRAKHISKHLNKKVGDRIRIGFVGGGPIGEAILVNSTITTPLVPKHTPIIKASSKAVATTNNSERYMVLEILPGTLRLPPERPAVQLALGVPFPKVVKQLWPIVVSLGVERILYAPAALTDPAYMETSSLTEPVYSTLIREGLAQAEETRLPHVCVEKDRTIQDLLLLMSSIESSIRQHEFEEEDDDKLILRGGDATRMLLAAKDCCKIVLHIGDYPSIRECYKLYATAKDHPQIKRQRQQQNTTATSATTTSATTTMTPRLPPPNRGIFLAIGPERGWTDEEVQAFQHANFHLASLGAPILRTDTAVIAAIALARDVLLEELHGPPQSS